MLGPTLPESADFFRAGAVNHTPNPATNARPGSSNVQRTLGGLYRGPENRQFLCVRMNTHVNYKIQIQIIKLLLFDIYLRENYEQFYVNPHFQDGVHRLGRTATPGPGCGAGADALYWGHGW